MSTLPRHLLPQSLQIIAEYCGDDSMWRLWTTFAGGRLHVPLVVEPGHRLVEVLGIAAAGRLCKAFGGELLTIPRAEAARRAVRNELIRQAKRDGVDNLALATRFQLTDRQIMAICRQDAPCIMNYDLFD